MSWSSQRRRGFKGAEGSGSEVGEEGVGSNAYPRDLSSGRYPRCSAPLSRGSADRSSLFFSAVF